MAMALRTRQVCDPFGHSTKSNDDESGDCVRRFGLRQGGGRDDLRRSGMRRREDALMGSVGDTLLPPPDTLLVTPSSGGLVETGASRRVASTLAQARAQARTRSMRLAAWHRKKPNGRRRAFQMLGFKGGLVSVLVARHVIESGNALREWSEELRARQRCRRHGSAYGHRQGTVPTAAAMVQREQSRTGRRCAG